MHAPWLEGGDEFEGVGAHPLNPRYDHDTAVADAGTHEWIETYARGILRRQQSFVAPASLDWSFLTRRFDCMDGSHYQPDAGPFDIDVLDAASPGDAIMWKATQSLAYVDPTMRRVRADARTRFRRRLFYHWLSSITDPVEQGKHYLRTMGEMPGGEGCMLDAEEGGITVERCLAFMETVERVLRRPCSVYSGLYVAGGTIWRDPRIRMSEFGPRPMHLAAYISVTSLRTRLVQLGVAHLALHFWQYSSDGPVPGVTGRCDMNAIFSSAMLDASAGTISVPIDPPEDTMSYGFRYNNQPRDLDGVTIDPGGFQYALIHDGERITKQRILPPGVSDNPRTDPAFSGLSNATLDGIPDYTGMKYGPSVGAPRLFRGVLGSVPGELVITADA